MTHLNRFLFAFAGVLLLLAAYLKGHTDAIQENIAEMTEMRDRALELEAMARTAR